MEDGVIAYSVHAVTIAGNLRSMYQGVVALGSEVDRFGAIHTGPVLLGELTVTGG